MKADKMEKGGIRIIEPQKIIKNEKKFLVSLRVYLLVIKRKLIPESNKAADGPGFFFRFLFTVFGTAFY